MGRKSIGVAAVTLVAGLVVAACADPSVPQPPQPVAPQPAVTLPRATASPEPRERWYAVGSRELDLRRGDRQLRTVVLYPATGHAADGRPADVPAGQRAGGFRPAVVKPHTDAVPSRGRFPLVLFSHGLHGSPERYTPAAASWAAAGFVVALPAYPHTSVEAGDFEREDIKNQPADAAYVITKVRELGSKAGDPLNGRIDGDRVAAVGHSAGGYTTTGLFTRGHDSRLKAGIVLAGWLAPGAFAGPPADMLFIQGDADPVVPVADGRAAFDRVPWPKSYILLPRNTHAQYMLPGKQGYEQMDTLVTDFLRWTLNDDEAAHLRMPPSDFPAGEAD